MHANQSVAIKQLGCSNSDKEVTVRKYAAITAIKETADRGQVVETRGHPQQKDKAGMKTGAQEKYRKSLPKGMELGHSYRMRGKAFSTKAVHYHIAFSVSYNSEGFYLG